MNNQPLGKISKNNDGYTVQYERIFDHSIERVWDAITNPEKLSLWFMGIELDLTPGAKITMTFGDEARTKSYGKILKVDKPNLFEWLWLNEEGGQDELARWELTKLGDEQTKLTLPTAVLMKNMLQEYLQAGISCWVIWPKYWMAALSHGHSAMVRV
jgi:uncharacterized protein YndB with AHSA1/START domain